mgnify:CR=1 FL=1
MSNERKSMLASVFALAWQFIKRNGFGKSQALKCAWANVKLKASMRRRIVKFYYRKVNGEIREAYGTLQEKLLPPILGTGRRPGDTLFVYFDTERGEYRSFKRANLLSADIS